MKFALILAVVIAAALAHPFNRGQQYSEIPEIQPEVVQQNSEIPEVVTNDEQNDTVSSDVCDSGQVELCFEAYNQYCSAPTPAQMCDPCYKSLARCVIAAGCEDDPTAQNWFESCRTMCSDDICNNAPRRAASIFLFTAATLFIFVFV